MRPPIPPIPPTARLLRPAVALTPLAQPVHPFVPPPLVPRPLAPAELDRLHRLSALSAPPAGSAEAAQLAAGLAELVGLMDGVHDVELPEGEWGEVVRELLGEGVGEYELRLDAAGEVEGGAGAAADGKAEAAPAAPAAPAPLTADVPRADGPHGRALLGYATRRVGDFYAARIGAA